MTEETEFKTYRGGSLEELLPLIRDELGPDAMIMRQREGVVGGVGGFFGRKCVEVDVRPPALPATLHAPAVPRGAVFSAYDTDLEPAPVVETAPEEQARVEPDEVEEGDLMEALLAQSSPFADELAQAWQTEVFDAPDDVAEELAVVPVEAPADTEEVRALLARAGIPHAIATAVVEDAEVRLRPFAPDRPLRTHVRAALARRIRVDLGGARTQRRLALVGLAGAGRTLAAAKLCGSYARGGLNVCALSLESARNAFELASVTEPFGVALEAADHPSTVDLVRKRMRGYDLVVADTPAVDIDDPASLRRLTGLLAAFRPTEIVLVLPADTPGDAARLLVRTLREHMKVRSLLVSHGDAAQAGGTAVGVSLAEKLPISFVSDGPLATAGIRPAAADELARMVLR